MPKSFSLILIVFFVSLTLLTSVKSVQAAISPITADVTISALLGEPKMRLWGYAPSSSWVKLTGEGISDSTRARLNGYYEFNSVFLPIPPEEEKDGFIYPEICIQAIDQFNLTSQPTCIPPLTYGNYFYDIGPVVISPTLRLEKGGVTTGEQIIASGITTPKTEVEIYLARENKAGFLTTLVKEVSAYYIPKYQILSDSQGYYEFNMPSDSPDTWRVFASSIIEGSFSPKSNSLKFEVLPQWMIVLRQILYFFGLLRPYLIYLLIFLEIILLFLLLKGFPAKKTRHGSKHHMLT